MTPTFSVVIPTYNRASLLRRSVASVIAGGYDDFELLIVDDGSEDDTRDVIADIHDSRIAYFEQCRRGAASARNYGANHANGKYITFLDSDDEALPGWLSKLGDSLKDSDICSGGYERVDSNGEFLEVRKPVKLGPSLGNVVGLFTHSGTYAMRREIFTAVGGFSEQIPASQHTELAYRLIPLAKISGWSVSSVPDPLIRYYANSEDGIRANDRSVLLASEYIIEVHGELLKKDPLRLASSHAVASTRATRIGEIPRARMHARRSLRIHPRDGRGWIRCLVLHSPVYRILGRS